MQHEPIEPVLREQAEQVVVAASPVVLQQVVLAIALHADDLAWAEEFCERFSSHPDSGVRGSALLGFGHLARRFRHLDASHVQPLIGAGFTDSDPWVREQSEAAAMDVESYLGWRLRRPRLCDERSRLTNRNPVVRRAVVLLVVALLLALMVFTAARLTRGTLRRGFDRVQIGMTRQHVQSILGDPVEHNFMSEGFPMHAEFWELKNGEVQVQKFDPPWKIYMMYSHASRDCDYWSKGPKEVIVNYDNQNRVVGKLWFDSQPDRTLLQRIASFIKLWVFGGICARNGYGFRTAEVAKLALLHNLGRLPEPEFTHQFC